MSGGISDVNPVLEGATDGTLIGNVGDRLKVTGTITGGSNSQDYVENNQVFSAAAIINAATSGTDNPLLLFKNPSGSGKTVYIIDIFAGTVIENNYMLFKVFSNPTITLNGVALTNFQRNIGNSPANGSSLTYTLPTLSVLGNLIATSIAGSNTISVDLIKPYSLALQANNNLLITGDPKSHNRTASVTVTWVEI